MVMRVLYHKICGFSTEFDVLTFQTGDGIIKIVEILYGRIRALDRKGLNMNKKKLLYAILCAVGSGCVGFFANQLTEAYACVLFGLGVGLMVYSITNLAK